MNTFLAKLDRISLRWALRLLRQLHNMTALRLLAKYAMNTDAVDGNSRNLRGWNELNDE